MQGNLSLEEALQQAIAHHHAGRLAEAEPLYRAILQLQPRHPDAQHNLGILAWQHGHHQAALTHLLTALEVDPGHAQYRASCCEILTHLGTALQKQGRPEIAENHFRQALNLQKDAVGTLCAFGDFLRETGRLEEAADCLLEALTRCPDHMPALNNLGLVLQRQGRLDDAEKMLRHALTLAPGQAELHGNLGIVLAEQGRIVLAESCLRQALALQPDHAEAHNNLGHLLRDQGRLAEADACYRRALALRPESLAIHDNLLFIPGLDPHQFLADAKQYGKRVADLATPFSHHPDPGDVNRRLRVGMVSGDFRFHPVGYFLEGVLAALPQEEIELFAYSAVLREDAMTQRIRASVPNWRPIRSLSDAGVAAQIRQDGIDILIDLAGHTVDNRLPVFAWKPAPLQVAWLGYFATTGVAAMDYLLGDAINLPEEECWQYVEKPWRLPECHLCFTPPTDAPDVAPLPAARNGFITFGCFNKQMKLNAGVLDCWAEILRRVPDSRLLLKNASLADPTIRQRLIDRFRELAIAPERLLLEAAQPRTAYLAAYHRVDIALDPFPFPGGTTTVEGLWMGVLCLTMRGTGFIAHQGETLLTHAGLPDWIADDTTDYIAKAVAFANDLQNLVTLRANLRAQLVRSPLCDAPRFARHLTQAWREMWRAWCLQEAA
ncbi:MAG: tetratricopeptide repeat protein [Magnetococcales bacterium]|nr:tetratricopeptide repeat protein [Magnetococcales bacterium]